MPLIINVNLLVVAVVVCKVAAEADGARTPLFEHNHSHLGASKNSSDRSLCLSELPLVELILATAGKKAVSLVVVS